MIAALQDTIRKLKKEKNIAILAHSYQSTEILEVADLVGDSFQLSLAARDIDCDTARKEGHSAGRYRNLPDGRADRSAARAAV